MTIEATLERIADSLEKIAHLPWANLLPAATPVGITVADSATTVAPTATPVTEVIPAKRGRGRPPKAAAPVSAEITAPAVEIPTPVPAGSLMVDFLSDVKAPEPVKAATKDQLRAALVALDLRLTERKEDGKAKAFELIRKFGGTNLNDVPEHRYGELVAACEAVK